MQANKEKNICYIIDAETLKVKDIQKLSDYKIENDDETNATSDIYFSKKFIAKDEDYILVKTENRNYLGIFFEIPEEKDSETYVAKVKHISNIFDRDIFVEKENIIKDVGIEDFIKETIEDNFSNSNDNLLNKSYIEVIVKTHTKLKKSVDNEDGKYNFHTYITNCKQNYDIDIKYEFINKKLVITIENKKMEPVLIDCTIADVIDYKEIFEKRITAKVRVKCKDTGNIKEYFLNSNRNVIDNINDPERVKGKVVCIVVEKEEEAYQNAVDQFKGNSYNYLVEFSLNKNSKLMNEKKIDISTLVKIKTKSNIILEGYITGRIEEKGNNIIFFKSGKIRKKLTDKLKKGGIY